MIVKTTFRINSSNLLVWILIVVSYIQLATSGNVESNYDNHGLNSKKFCSFNELVSDSPYEKGRWTSSVRNTNHDDDVISSTIIEYQPNNCSIPSKEDIDFVDMLGGCLAEVEKYDGSFMGNYINVIFIGGTAAKKQKDIFDNLKGDIFFETTYVPFTFDVADTTTNEEEEETLEAKLDNLVMYLDDLFFYQWWETKFIIFDSGSLYDIEQSMLNHNNEYRDAVTRFVNYIAYYEATVKIFQSTLVGWMSPPPQQSNSSSSISNEVLSSSIQPSLLLSSTDKSSVGYYNKVTYDAIQQANYNNKNGGLNYYLEIPNYEIIRNTKIYMVDGYWIDLPKNYNSYNTETISSTSSSGSSDPSDDVLDTMGRITWMLLLNTFCPDRLNQI